MVTIAGARRTHGLVVYFRMMKTPKNMIMAQQRRANQLAPVNRAIAPPTIAPIRALPPSLIQDGGDAGGWLCDAKPSSSSCSRRLGIFPPRQVRTEALWSSGRRSCQEVRDAYLCAKVQRGRLMSHWHR